MNEQEYINKICNDLRNIRVIEALNHFKKLSINTQHIFFNIAYNLLKKSNLTKGNIVMVKMFFEMISIEQDMYNQLSLQLTQKERLNIHVLQNILTINYELPSVSPVSDKSKSSVKRSRQVKIKETSSKFDKKYQKFPSLPETSPLYLFYTSTYRESPESEMAIKWLTEHGVFEGVERAHLVSKYENLQ